ncbi:Kelch repeat type 1 [Akanthomyces lecanii RCEF 1005]|uniref:Kelch repeat type 1 n=1 Tax=Akanthomyces lecanii RCEF 1005 TaxID=1081108 RepID=A0A168C5Y2_CORDF|nr:Kelch repeat type 1 [Akanthomyces lecanii RCEF 1005]
MEQVKLLRRRTTDLLANAQQNMASTQQSFLSSAQQNIANAQQNLPALSMPQFSLRGLGQSPTSTDHGPKGTWERIDDIPALQRSGHSLDIVADSAYIFGGEGSDDNDMHVVRLPVSGASADYYRITAMPEKPDDADPTSTDDPDEQEPSDGGAGSEAGSGSIISNPRIKNKGKERAIDVAKPDLGDVPAPRAGHATAVVGSRILLFGGRGIGPESKPLEEAGRVWVFDTRTRAWSHLDPAPAVMGGAITIHPGARSNHCATATDKPQDFGSSTTDNNTTSTSTTTPGLPPLPSPTTLRSRAESWRDWAVGDISKTGTPQDPIVGYVAESAVDEESRGYGTLFIHAGSLASGDRSNDIWAFDVRSRMWSELPSAPGPARDGAGICISKSRLFRFGGFDGTSAVGGQLDYLHLEVETMDDKRRPGNSGGKTEVAVRARDGWQTVLQHPTSTYSSTAMPLEPLASPRVSSISGPPEIPATGVVQEWPCPRSAASFEAMTMGGGREVLVLAFGATSADQQQLPLDDVWLFQVPPQGMSAASVTAALMQAVGRKTGEGRWTRVATRPHDDEEQDWASLPRARAGLASAPMTNLEDSGLLVWGGLGEDGKRLGDGWVLRL